MLAMRCWRNRRVCGPPGGSNTQRSFVALLPRGVRWVAMLVLHVWEGEIRSPPLAPIAITRPMDLPDEARAYLIARELIEEHGDEVGAFLEAKIRGLMNERHLDQLNAWFIIRNAVALTLEGGEPRH